MKTWMDPHKHVEVVQKERLKADIADATLPPDDEYHTGDTYTADIRWWENSDLLYMDWETSWGSS